MYLFNEMHTDSEQIAVPHPPQCAHWGTFPPGGRYGAAHPHKFQFIQLLSKTDMHKVFMEYPDFSKRHICFMVKSLLWVSWFS